jgi:outer membrane protein TolC
MKYFLLTIFILYTVLNSIGQMLITRETAVKRALSNNPEMKIAGLQTEQVAAMKGQSFNFPNPELLWQAPTATFYTPGILIAAENPAAYFQQYQSYKAEVKVSEASQEVVRNKTIYLADYYFTELQYYAESERLLEDQSAVYDSIAAISRSRYNLGDITNLEKMNSEAGSGSASLQLAQTLVQKKRILRQFALLIGTIDSTYIPDEKFEKGFFDSGRFDTNSYRRNPLNDFYLRKIDFSEKQIKKARTGFYPGLIAGYLNQGLRESSVRYRFQFGITLPLSHWNNISRVRVAQKGLEISRSEFQLNKNRLTSEQAQALAELEQYERNISYFETTGKQLSEEILRSSRISYKAGQIGYYEYLQSVRQAFDLKAAYLNSVRGYNQAIHLIEYLNGNR